MVKKFLFNIVCILCVCCVAGSDNTNERQNKKSTVPQVVFSKDKKTLLKVSVADRNKVFSIPDGVTAVSAMAFNYPRPVCVEISATVSDIAEGAFWGVKKIKLSASNSFFVLDKQGALIDKRSGKLLFVPEIASGEYTVSQDVREIAENCISNNLNKIIITENVQKISNGSLKLAREIQVAENSPYFTICENGALIDRKKQEIVYFPQKIKREPGKFAQIIHVNYVVPTDVIRIGKGAFKDNLSVKNIKFHNNFVEIDDEGCQNVNVKKIDIPDSVKRIGRHAFHTGLCTQCSTCKVGIDELTISAGVEEIGAGAFIGVKKLLLAPGNSCFKMDSNGILIDTRKNEIIYLPPLKKGVLQIPSGISKIGAYAGTNNQVNGLIIPAGVSEIGDSAFAGTRSLRVAVLSEGLKKIGSRAFANSGINTISIPESVTFVGEKAFEYSRQLSKIIVPDHFSMAEIKKWGIPKYCKVIRISEMKKTLMKIDNLPVWSVPLDGKKIEKNADSIVAGNIKRDNDLKCTFPTMIGDFRINKFTRKQDSNEYEICYKNRDIHVSIHVYPTKSNSLKTEVTRSRESDRKKLITLCNVGATDVGISKVSEVIQSNFVKNCQYSFYRFVSTVPALSARRESPALVICFYKNAKIVKLTIFGFDKEIVAKRKFMQFAKVFEQVILADRGNEFSLLSEIGIRDDDQYSPSRGGRHTVPGRRNNDVW